MAGIPTSGPRLAAFRANPGLRAKLPTRLLTPAQQRQRAMNARLNAPVFDGSSLTNRALSREVQAAQQEKYGPAVSQARSNLGSAQQFQNRIGDWYDQYRNALATAQQQIRDSGVQGQQDIQGLLGAANNGFAQDQAGLKESPALAQQAQQGQAIRAMLTGSFGAMMANSANAANNRAALQTNVVAPTAKFNAQQASQGNITKARQALTSLLGQEGAFGQQYRGQRLTAEQKNALAAQALGISQEKVGLAAQALNVNARDKSQKRIIARQKIKVAQSSPSAQKTAQEVQFFKQHGYYPPTGPPKAGKNGAMPRTGPGSLKPAAESKIVSSVNTLASMIQAAPKTDQHGKPNNIRGNLIEGKYPHGRLNDPRVVDLAFDLVQHGGKLSPRGVKLAHQLGIHVGGNFQQAPAPTRIVAQSKPVPAAPPLTAGTSGIPGLG